MDLGTRTGLDPEDVDTVTGQHVFAGASEAAKVLDRIIGNVARVVKGNNEAIRLAVTCLIAGGHLLVEDVPGVGKTSLGKALSASVSCRHRRIQFTSDLLPADVTGVSVFDLTKASFEFQKGRSSPISSLAMRSTGLPLKPSRPCWRRWRSAKSPSTGRPTPCRTPSW